jgi:hypothetical protein
LMLELFAVTTNNIFAVVLLFGDVSCFCFHFVFLFSVSVFVWLAVPRLLETNLYRFRVSVNNFFQK